jgi:1-acyl-sn-glycerol-3-phosphate acyltransferase
MPAVMADPPVTPFPCRVVSDPERVWRRMLFWHRLLSPAACRLWGGDVRGREHVPDGPVIVVANHLSTFDTILLGWALPRVGAFLAKAEILGWPVVGPEAIRLGGFPADRGKGDQTAFVTALSILDAGHPVVLHPEGSRSPNGLYGVQRLRAGAARFALARPVPILPVALFGTDGIWPRGRIWPGRGTASAEFGPPILPETYLPPSDWPIADQIRQINVAIDTALRALIPPHLQAATPTPGLAPC